MRTRSWFVPIAGMLTATAWLALWLWEQSPYGRYLDHPRWTEIGLASAICRVLPAGENGAVEIAGYVTPGYAGTSDSVEDSLSYVRKLVQPATAPQDRARDRNGQERKDH